MEDQKTLQAGTLVGQLPDAIQYQVNDLLADGIVTTGIIVGCILFAGNQLLWMKQLAIGSSADLIDDRWL